MQSVAIIKCYSTTQAGGACNYDLLDTTSNNSCSFQTQAVTIVVQVILMEMEWY